MGGASVAVASPAVSTFGVPSVATLSRRPLGLASSTATEAHPVNPYSNLGSPALSVAAPSVAVASPAVSTFGAPAVATTGGFISGPAFSSRTLGLASSTATVAHPVNPYSNLGSPALSVASPVITGATISRPAFSTLGSRSLLG